EDGSLEEGGEDFGLDSNEDEVVPNVEEESLVDGVLVGAFGGVGEEDVVIGLKRRGLSGSLGKIVAGSRGEDTQLHRKSEET
ncbi:hypothetical protein Tco_1552320, partial [Tanacetum coccineum]